MATLTVVTPGFVALNISSTASSLMSKTRFDKSITISELKMKLEMISGCNVATMRLQLYNADDKFITDITDDDALLGSLSVDDGMRIHVSDPTLRQGEFEDVSRVAKFEISEEQYAQKTDTVRAFKERNKLGRFKELTPEELAGKEEEKARLANEIKAALDRLKLEDRCSVAIPNQPSRLGTIKYLGETTFKDGFWVGVQYDEPVGKNDGSVDGKRYFTCPQKYGGFVRPVAVTAGDFPPEEFDVDEM